MSVYLVNTSIIITGGVIFVSVEKRAVIFKTTNYYLFAGNYNIVYLNTCHLFQSEIPLR